MSKNTAPKRLNNTILPHFNGDASANRNYLCITLFSCHSLMYAAWVCFYNKIFRQDEQDKQDAETTEQGDFYL